jgi:AraC family transcriptional regulator of adaptative response / DNA-3-methyladenine glycosylase II
VAAGFGSTRRFNDTFKNTYGRSPRELRKIGRQDDNFQPEAKLSVRLPYRQPFAWNELLEFFRHRVTPGVEEVIDDCYRRTLLIENKHAVIELRPSAKGNYLSLTMHNVSTSSLFETVQRARDVFDLDAPVAEITSVLAADPSLRKALKAHRGIRVPGAWDGFELTIRAILGQQISVKAATTLAGRIAARYGEPFANSSSGDSGLHYMFPTANRLSRARFNGIGLVGSRAATLRRVASACVRGELQFDSAQDPQEFCTTLKSIKGIGDWTAQYVAMRALKHPDAFPASDLGLLKALRQPERVSPAELSHHAEHWRPWRAYGALLLWNSLSGSGG